jgi:LacI family transcriptional regulator
LTLKIQEIARITGASTATVSRVFSNHPNVRKEIRQKVLAAAKEYKYHPRLSVKRRNIVVLTPLKQLYPVQGYVEMVLSELSPHLTERDFRIEIVPQNNLELLSRISFQGAVGISLDKKLLQEYDRTFAVPLVNIDTPLPERCENLYCVRSDEDQGMSLAIDCLKNHKRRNVGVILYGREDVGNGLIRKNAVIKALKKASLPCNKERIIFAYQEEYLESVGKLLLQNVDSLFCPGGNGGILTAYAVSLYGKKIPQDIALVSSERAVYSRYALPPQSVISQDYEAMGQCVADVLEGVLTGKKIPRESVIPYKLIERDSV